MISLPTLDLQIETLRAALRRADPHASVGYDAISRALRIRSALDLQSVHRLAAGLEIDLAALFAQLDVRQRGTDCCGGCG